jgi:hypothetical protein
MASNSSGDRLAIWILLSHRSDRIEVRIGILRKLRLQGNVPARICGKRNVLWRSNTPRFDASSAGRARPSGWHAFALSRIAIVPATLPPSRRRAPPLAAGTRAPPRPPPPHLCRPRPRAVRGQGNVGCGSWSAFRSAAASREEQVKPQRSEPERSGGERSGARPTPAASGCCSRCAAASGSCAAARSS